MDHSFEYYVDHEHRTNINIFKGTICLDTLLNFLKDTFSKTDYKDDYDILIDISKSDLPDFLPRLDEYVQFLVQSAEVINWKRKCAIITAKPRDVVIAELLRQKLLKNNFDLVVGVFSTRNAALFWLG